MELPEQQPHYSGTHHLLPLAFTIRLKSHGSANSANSEDADYKISQKQRRWRFPARGHLKAFSCWDVTIFHFISPKDKSPKAHGHNGLSALPNYWCQNTPSAALPTYLQTLRTETEQINPSPVFLCLSGEEEEERFREHVRGRDGQIKDATMRVARPEYDGRILFRGLWCCVCILAD